MDNASTALVDRIVGAGLATMEMFTVHLGLRHAPYRALHERGRANPRELAAADIYPRYAREWLEKQAVAALGDDVKRLNHAFSVLRRCAERAGFGRVEVLPIAHNLWRFYRLGA
jgi:hypothetical protein